MKVVYFGAFDAAASPRVRMLREGLRRNGVEVIDCHATGTALPRWSRLSLALPRAARDADLLLVGKPGQREMPLARLWANALGLPLALDLFASLWLNEVTERRRVAPAALAARKLRMLDRFALRHADLCLVDTIAHGRTIAESLLPGRAIAPQRRVFVGAEPCFVPRTPPPVGDALEALFVGTFIPFHGVEVILRAAALLRAEPRLRFTLLGDGQERPAMEALAAELALPNVRFEAPIDYPLLPARLARADLALGIFGTSATARAVIPKKVFAALATGVPVVTGDGEGVREALDESCAYLCPAGDPAALAATLQRALADGPRREEIAARGIALHRANFTPTATGGACRLALAELLNRTRGLPSLAESFR
ncbi:MAG: glycosyltransferase family 4 protein [Planctomycetes bacterium]|nr:glycosyltransferase family 4 protein [Planctomycetota bacterium]